MLAVVRPTRLAPAARRAAGADHFAGGMALAVVSAAGRRAPAPPVVGAVAARRGGLRGRCPLAAGAGFPARRVAPPPRGPIVALVLPPRDRGRRGGARDAAAPLARWVGLVSYGLYLWHLDVMRELSSGAGWSAGLGVLVAGRAGARARRRELVLRRAPVLRAGRRAAGARGGPSRPSARARSGRAMSRARGAAAARAARRPAHAGVLARGLLRRGAPVGGLAAWRSRRWGR